MALEKATVRIHELENLYTRTVNSYGNEIQEYKQQIEALNRKSVGSSKDLPSIVNSLTETKAEIEQVKKSYENIVREKSILQGQLSVSHGENAQLKISLSKIESELKQVQSQFQQQISQQETQFQEITRSNVQEIERLKSLNAEMIQRSSANHQLQEVESSESLSETKKLRELVAEISSKEKVMMDEAALLKKELDERIQELNAQRQRELELNQSLESLSKELDVNKQSISQQSKDIESLQQRVTELINDNTHLVSELTVVKSQTSELESLNTIQGKMLEDLYRSSSSGKVDQSATDDHHPQRMMELEEQIKEMESLLTDRVQLMEAELMELGELRNTNAELSSKLEKVTMDKNTIEAQLESLQSTAASSSAMTSVLPSSSSPNIPSVNLIQSSSQQGNDTQDGLDYDVRYGYVNIQSDDVTYVRSELVKAINRYMSQIDVYRSISKEIELYAKKYECSLLSENGNVLPTRKLLSNVLSKVENAKNETQQQLEEMRSGALVSEQYLRLEQTLKAASENLSDSKRKLENSESRLHEKDMTINEMNQSLHDCQQQIQQMQNQLGDSKMRIDQLLGNAVILKGTVETRNHQLDQARQQYSDMLVEVSQKSSENDQMKEVIMHSQERIDTLNTSLEREIGRSNQLKQTVDQLHQQLQAKAQTATNEAELNRLRKQASKMSSHLNEVVEWVNLVLGSGVLNLKSMSASSLRNALKEITLQTQAVTKSNKFLKEVAACYSIVITDSEEGVVPFLAPETMFLANMQAQHTRNLINQCYHLAEAMQLIKGTATILEVADAINRINRIILTQLPKVGIRLWELEMKYSQSKFSDSLQLVSQYLD